MRAEVCGAPGCEGSLEHRKAGAIYCSKVCNDEAQRFKRLAAKAGVTPEEYHGRIEGRTCASPECDASLDGMRRHAKFCSRACKMKASDKRRRRPGIANPEAGVKALPAPGVCSTPGCDSPLVEVRPGTLYCSRNCYYRARYMRQAEQRKEYAKQYLKDNPERMRNIRRRRKLRQTASYDSRLITEKDWARLVSRYRGCCAYCGERPDTLHREHVIPLSRGGRHAIGNIVPACPRCNLSKHTAFLVEWKQRIGGDYIS